MRMRLNRLVGAVLSSLLVIVGCSWEPKFGLDSKAARALTPLPGKIGLKFRNYDGNWNFVIEQGHLSEWKILPDAPREATSAIGPFGAENLIAPAGYNYQGPYLLSPDRRFIVASVVTRIPYEREPTTFLVVDVQTKQPFAQLHLTDNFVVEGFAWSPDSKWIALLRSRGHFKWWRPTGFVSLLAGHPIRYLEFHLDIVDRECKLIATTGLVHDLRPGANDLVWLE